MGVAVQVFMLSVLMAVGKKLSLSLDVRVLICLYLLPEGSSWKSSCPGCEESLPTQNVSMRHSGNETQQSTHFLVHSGTTLANPTDSAFKFNNLCIILTWCELQLALHSRNFLLWYLEYISEPELYYFDLRREVESVLLPLPEVSVLVTSMFFCLNKVFGSGSGLIPNGTDVQTKEVSAESPATLLQESLI